METRSVGDTDRRLFLLRSFAVIAAAIPFGACDSGDVGGQDPFAVGQPQWQRIESSEPPAAWRVEEASISFDAWETSAVVTGLSSTDAAAAIRFDDGDGGVLDVRLASLTSGPFEPAVAEGDSVHVALIRQEGFEGVARGLVIRDRGGRLLLLYDDGGYGNALHDEGARGGVDVTRSLRGPGSGGGWESRPVTFRLGRESVVCAEGESARLSSLSVAVVVSREWAGEAPTDVDVSPLAYLIFLPR